MSNCTAHQQAENKQPSPDSLWIPMGEDDEDIFKNWQQPGLVKKKREKCFPVISTELGLFFQTLIACVAIQAP